MAHWFASHAPSIADFGFQVVFNTLLFLWGWRCGAQDAIRAFLRKQG